MYLFLVLLKEDDPKYKDTAITAAVGCFSIILIIIIIMTVIWKITKSCGFQKRKFLCIKYDENNTTPREDVI